MVAPDGRESFRSGNPRCWLDELNARSVVYLTGSCLARGVYLMRWRKITRERGGQEGRNQGITKPFLFERRKAILSMRIDRNYAALQSLPVTNILTCSGGCVGGGGCCCLAAHMEAAAHTCGTAVSALGRITKGISLQDSRRRATRDRCNPRATPLSDVGDSHIDRLG